MSKKICDITRSIFDLILGILPIVFWSCLMFSFDETIGATVTILAMIIHEFGHLSCIFILTGRWRAPVGKFNGLRISGQDCNSYIEQILNYASGALFNILSAALALIFCKNKTEYLEIFITINLATAISNLLPIDGYDGYRLIFALINYMDLGFVAFAILEILSFVVTASMCLLSLFLVYSFGNGYWFLFIFLFATIKKLQKWQNHQNSRI